MYQTITCSPRKRISATSKGENWLMHTNLYVHVKYLDENGLEIEGPDNKQRLLNDIRCIVAEEVRAALEKQSHTTASKNQWPFCPICNKMYASAAFYDKPIVSFGNLPISKQYPQYCFGSGSCAPAECSECHWMIPAGREHDCTRLKEIRRGL